MKYSVLYEPCISVQMLDDTFKWIGMREAIVCADKIKDIYGETPLERYAVMRLLISLAMDMLHPKDSYERRAILEQGQFDPNMFDRYIAECEEDGPRFDLFDPVHPFMQSPYDETIDAKAEKPVAVIIHSYPSGNNHVFVDHRKGDQHEISCAKAFQALCASYVFCVSGTSGPSSINNTPPLYAIMLGKNLFETLVMNMLSQSEASPLPYGTGMVPWRMEWKVIPRKSVADVTLLEGLTWMPRRITLIQNDQQKVQRVYCQAGLDFKGNELWTDPHVPRIKRKKDDTYSTIKPELGRDFWRDAGTLFYDHDGKAVRQPNVFRCIENIYDEEDFPERIQVRVAGLITNQAAYTAWMEGELQLPATMLFEQTKADLFRADIDFVERLQYQISTIVQRNVDILRKGGSGKEHEISTQCQQYFLHGAHEILFGECMMEICNGMESAEHNESFCNAMKKLLKIMINHILYASGNTSQAMIKQLDAERLIWDIFYKMENERKESNA